jgi:hypothetical protein
VVGVANVVVCTTVIVIVGVRGFAAHGPPCGPTQVEAGHNKKGPKSIDESVVVGVVSISSSIEALGEYVALSSVLICSFVLWPSC